MKEELKEKLYPLYEELVKIEQGKNLVSFCAQWGENYKPGGILFVGRAVNGWHGPSRDCRVLFSENGGCEQIFACKDQMRWVEDRRYDSDSAFWRVIKKVTQRAYHCEENWSSHIAWSNLCKLAPKDGGNPSNTLCKEQYDLCLKILQAELDVLQPEIIVLLTNRYWCADFLYDLNNQNDLVPIETVNWERYEVLVYKINERIYIVSEHPQCKPEQSHVATLTKLIEKYQK